MGRAGEEINVRYTGGVLEPAPARQQTISAAWHFSCRYALV